MPPLTPPQPYQPLDPLIANYHPQEPVTLSTQIFTTSLCRARKGAAPGPSGLTAETLRLVLDDEEATNKLIQVTQQIARAELPDTASQALGLGRLVALQKPNGRVRGLVIGDLLRRLVARSLAQQFSQHIHQACSPHQYALSTRAATEAVVHAITSATELDPNNTIVSVDGIGAYDTIARHSMLQALHAVPEAYRCLPFVRLFYAQPSTYVWHDGDGNAHPIIQAEGGEQGDPLMPALYSLGQHSALQHTQQQLQAGERLYAYLDDVYLVVPPHRVETAYRILAHELQQHAHIQLNPAKTRVWNNSGHRPPNAEHLGPEEWVGARELPPEQQGITILGTPIGTPEFQATHLQATADQHSALLQRIPAIQDLQAEWLLLLYCASPRCNYLLRMLRPEITQPFAQAHDTAITLALAQLLDMRDLAPTALGIAHLPLHLGGLGLTSASLLSHSAYWADTLPILHRQDPTNTATILQHLHRGTAAVPSLQAITEAQQQLQHHGFNPPSWEELAAGRAAPPHLGPDQAHPTLNARSRMATARRPVIPPQLPPRTPQPSRPRQPSLVGFPVRTARQPRVHHDPLWPRHNIPTAYLPNPALETPPSRVASVSSPLSVPSHSRSLRRPPFSLCPGRGTSTPRSPTRKSSRQSLPRSRRPRDYKHTAHGLKHRQHPAAR